MLIEFSVANFRSFRDRVTLSLEAEPRISERDKTIDERNIAHTDHGDLLRVVGLYGANASGKSNLVIAMTTLCQLVLHSAREGQSGDALPAAPFRLDAESLAGPSELEVVFTLDRDQVRYGVAFTATRVEREYLFVRPPDADMEERWFERTRDSYETGDRWTRDPGIERKTRPEALHLSVAAAWNHAQADNILRWFQEGIVVVDSGREVLPYLTKRILREDSAERSSLCALIRRLDFGIDDLKLVDSPRFVPSERPLRRPRGLSDEQWLSIKAAVASFGADENIVAIRQGVAFDLREDESAGTSKAVALAGPIISALTRGGVLVVDEFDARLHTLLAKQLVELFQDPTTNPHDAQLVFASHDTNLLTRTLLRRDQLWFVEKSHKTHGSDLYSLAEIRLDDGKVVRNDARYEADYLQGKYGAIPFFGNLKAQLAEALERKD